MGLHIKYRPANFKDVIGNKIIIKSIKSMIDKKDRPQVYLFSGPSGCGKTTLARILSRELGCSSHDLTEVNSSNNRGIDTARDIINKMHYRPMDGKVRVYLLDEAHKTTKDFQNALLKSMEDTPKHVYFILCTTEPEVLVTAFRKRCSHFTVAPVPNIRLVRFMKHILLQEDMEDALTDEELEGLAKRAKGCPRDCLIFLDQVRYLDGDEKITVLSSLKSEEEQVVNLCKALVRKKPEWSAIQKILSRLKGTEPETIRRSVLGYFTAVAMNNTDACDKAALIIECFKDSYFYSGRAGLILSCYNVVF